MRGGRHETHLGGGAGAALLKRGCLPSLSFQSGLCEQSTARDGDTSRSHRSLTALFAPVAPPHPRLSLQRTSAARGGAQTHRREIGRKWMEGRMTGLLKGGKVSEGQSRQRQGRGPCERAWSRGAGRTGWGCFWTLFHALSRTCMAASSPPPCFSHPP